MIFLRPHNTDFLFLFVCCVRTTNTKRIRMKRSSAVLFLALLFGILACQAANSYYVDSDNGSDSNDCSKSSPCKTIQEALNLATNGGDTIQLYSGTYSGEGNVNLTINHAINIQAASTDNPPTINLNNEAWFANWSTDYLADTTQVAAFSYLVFVNGKGTDHAPSVVQVMGGSSLTFNHCNFTDCKAEHGAAVTVGMPDEDLSHEGPSIVSVLNCRFFGNQANQGPAVKAFPGHQRGVILFDSYFGANTAVDGNGGAVYAGDNVILSVAKCEFDTNKALDGGGGAIYSGESDPSMQVSIFQSNFIANSGAGRGGAVAMYGGTLVLEESTFQENEVTSGDTGKMGQYGGGIYTEGILLSTNSTFRSNVCPLTGSTAVMHEGGALYINGTGSSFIRGGTFDSNSCFHGSDFASETGSSTIIDGATYISDAYNDGDFQLQTTGYARFNDCKFTTSGDSSLVRSIAIKKDGLISFSWGSSSEAPNILAIEVLYLEQNSILQTPTSLNIQDMGSQGGTIESTTHLQTSLESSMMDLRQGTTTTITGFEVVTPEKGTFINEGGLILSQAYTNKGAASFNPLSFVRTVGAAAVIVRNEGTMDVNAALFSCNFLNYENATLKFPQVGPDTKQEPLTIEGVATLNGNLVVIVDEEGKSKYNEGEELLLMSYHSLAADRFATLMVKNISNPELVYGQTALTLQKGEVEGLSGGAVAGIIIGVTIALGILTLAAYFFIVKPQSQSLEEAYQGGEGGVGGDGYGAV